MPLFDCTQRVCAAALAATLSASPRPYLGPESVETPGEDPVMTAGEVETTTAGPATLHPDVTPQQHAVPPPPKWWARSDKKTRQHRGALAVGILFTAVCGAGAGLGIYAIAAPTRDRGEAHRDAIAGVTGLLSCTVGALALATTSAVWLKKRRGR